MKIGEVITGPIRDNDISYKSVYFTKEPVIEKIYGLELRRSIHGDELYYGLTDPTTLPVITLAGILQLEKYNNQYWQVRLAQIEEQYKSQGYGTYLYDYAVMNDGLTLLSDTILSYQALDNTGGSIGLWKRLYSHGRFTVCGYNLETDEILPDMKPEEVINQHDNVVFMATPKQIKESIDEMLSRINNKNKHRITEWYGPNIKQSNEF